MCVVLTCVVQTEGQKEVKEHVRQLLCWIGWKSILHHIQKKLDKFIIQVF